MKAAKLVLQLITISIIALCAGPASAWDARWRIKQEAPASSHSSGIRSIEMQKKFDHNSMNTFKGTTDSSSGYTVMRNLNGETMRGYINKDGSGLLRDDRGDFHNVNTRW